MPPVRWKKTFAIVVIKICLLLQILLPICTDGQQMQDAISMTSDGWRPIVGTRRQPQYNSEGEEITHYRNPIKNSETIKAEITLSSTSSPTSTTTDVQKLNKPQSENVLKPNFKKPLNVNGNHKLKFNRGPHIPLIGPKNNNFPLTNEGAIKNIRQNYPGQIINGRLIHGGPGPLNKILPGNNKHGNGKRIVKPIRIQNVAYSNRDEVFVPAPSTVSGAYTFINSNPNNIKVRETPGLGLFGNSFLTPPGQFDFTNRFSLPTNENVYQTFNTNPIQSFLFTKPPQTNDVHYQFQSQNDEYTRNLVPPPSPFKSFNDVKEKKRVNINIKESTIIPPPVTVPNESVDVKIQQNFKSNSPLDNFGLNVPPPFEQNFAFTQPNNKKKVEVQVTKEKLKVFHNQIPSNYNPQIDFADYDIHDVRNQPLPKIQNYEVTEGKWVDQSRPQSSFSFHQLSGESKKLHKINNKPNRFQQAVPQVELNVQPFLPTPFRPENLPAISPTSPTQADVSHVFSTVSNNMNKYREEILTNNPLFFDVKEVSTHFPILGRPELLPAPKIKENEMSNEITTNKINSIKWPPSGMDFNEITTLKEITNYTDIPVRQPGRRRRPGSRRTTTSTTTTEEPQQITANYEVQKEETERPQRKRPIRYRITTEAKVEELTSTENPSRVRQRTRNRGNIKNQQRKRLRPTTELPPNHKISPSDTGLVDYITTEGQYLKEITSEQNPESGSKYEQGAAPSIEESIIKDFETGILKLNPTSTASTSSSSTSEEYGTTEENQNLYSPTTEIQTTNVRVPENEIDFSTQQTESIDDDNLNQANIATTTPPISTTTETTTISSSTKKNRGRPMKYDTSNRPKFSVKDYRIRLNQYASTTTSTTTTTERSVGNNRLRYQSRLRTRPTTASKTDSETEKPTRGRFKSSKYTSTTTESNDAIITDKSIKSVNTRLRPFGRYRSTTTEAPATSTSFSSTPKVSIRPNLFAQRRRPPQLSLRDRINKLKSNKTTEENETEPTGHKETSQTTIIYDKDDNEVNTENYQDRTTLSEENEDEDINDKEDKNVEDISNSTGSADILRNDASIYSQRVSDLTSSSQNEYNTPGVFKSVSPNSRRVPSHFTISTEDPILPIEAFFPNIKDKDKERR